MDKLLFLSQPPEQKSGQYGEVEGRCWGNIHIVAWSQTKKRKQTVHLISTKEFVSESTLYFKQDFLVLKIIPWEFIMYLWKLS